MEPGAGMMSRREFLETAGAVALGAGSAACRSARHSGPAGNSAVSILRAASYQVDLVEPMLRGASLCGLEARGKRVLLKPNLVECDRSAVIHTDVAVLAAAVELFERLGAAEVLIGEGPGHRRDTVFLAEEAGYRNGIPQFDARFIDLNRDDVAAVLQFGGLERFYLPQAALRADLVVSLAKMKTHHWAGVSLAMKNLLGIVPGSVYGWPKNRLHHIGIERSVAEIYRLFPRSFAIVDGVIGMEGNGPIQGTPKHAGVLVMGGDLAAVDATCCRIMGIDPERIGYLRLASSLGRLEQERIEQRGEPLSSVQTEFLLIPEFRHVRLG